MWAPKLLLTPVKIGIFGPKMAIFMLSLAHVGLAGLFGALLY